MAVWHQRSSLSESKQFRLAKTLQEAFRGLLIFFLSYTAASCGPPGPTYEEAGAVFLSEWFQQGVLEDENRCHGMGVLKHQEFSCLDMQSYASKIEPGTRSIASVREHECFGSVCGQFLEIEMDSADFAGNPVRENAVLKKDDGVIRLYWYRSDLMLAAYKAANPDPEDEKDPIQVAYDEITGRYPELYQYPPCLDERVSSSVLVGEIAEKDQLDVSEIERLAVECGESFCFALVGQKIATLCPALR